MTTSYLLLLEPNPPLVLLSYSTLGFGVLLSYSTLSLGVLLSYSTLGLGVLLFYDPLGVGVLLSYNPLALGVLLFRVRLIFELGRLRIPIIRSNRVLKFIL